MLVTSAFQLRRILVLYVFIKHGIMLNNETQTNDRVPVSVQYSCIHNNYNQVSRVNHNRSKCQNMAT